MITRPAETFSSLSHLLGALLALIGTVALALRSASRPALLVSLVYGLSMTLMFAASALYHAKKRREGEQSVYRRLDHLAIFFMIAGTYTPVCTLYLEGAWRWSILGVQWGLVLLGAAFKLVFIRAPRAVSAAIYLTMGWVLLVPLHKLLQTMPTEELLLIGLGGLAYTAGAVIYAKKRPDPLPGRFGFHDIFHLCVLLGAALHYAAVFRMVG